MATIEDIVGNVTELPGDATVHARAPWTRDSEAVVTEGGRPPDGFVYLLEVDLVRDVLTVWADWRGRPATAAEGADAVIHYAVFDAYEPIANQ